MKIGVGICRPLWNTQKKERSISHNRLGPQRIIQKFNKGESVFPRYIRLVHETTCWIGFYNLETKNCISSNWIIRQITQVLYWPIWTSSKHDKFLWNSSLPEGMRINLFLCCSVGFIWNVILTVQTPMKIQEICENFITSPKITSILLEEIITQFEWLVSWYIWPTSIWS